MKIVFSLFSLLIALVQIQAQNLVPNGDFEQYYHCPQGPGQVDSCMFWINPANNNAANPDYFNQCSDTNVNVPNNFSGFQEAHSGKAYCGLVMYIGSGLPNYREYIEVPFKTTLEANSCYHLTLYVNSGNNSKCSSNDISVYFSDILISGVSNYFPFPFTPQFNNITTVLSDTLNWTLVEGDIQTVGDERFLIIGNYKNDASTTINLINPTANWQGAYLYIDDVSVYKCDTPIYTANAGVDKTICPGESTVLQMHYFPEYEYKWYAINGTLLDTSNIITVKPDSTTQYVLWISDFKYDQSYDTVTVFVDESCIPWVVPNVFTPNGDGFNDEFYAKCDRQLDFSISVFNRWGKKVFESTDNRHWDGKENGTPCAEGVYYYIVEAHFKNGKSQSKNGTVTLVR